MKTKLIFTLSILCVTLCSALVFYSCEEDEKDNLPPSITITSPNDGDVFDGNSLVTISTAPVDTDGVVMQVMFYVDGEYVASVSKSPFNFVLNTANYSMGIYRIKAKVTDDYGGVGSTSINIEIKTPPEPNFEANRTEALEGTTIYFTDLTTSAPTAWDWNFGDGSTSTDQNPQHTYTTAGLYTITLKATNEIGSAIETKTDYIEILSTKFTDDRDGQEYSMIEVGDQVWMANNLNYDDMSGFVWNYSNDPNQGNTYGKLYDWQIAQQICPSGWHLPSVAEWDTLIANTGDTIAAYNLKEEGQTHWASPSAASNSTGFTALPGGFFDGMNNAFDGITYMGYFWTSDLGDLGSAYGKKIYWNSDKVEVAYMSQSNGFSVRCVKD